MELVSEFEGGGLKMPQSFINVHVPVSPWNLAESFVISVRIIFRTQDIYFSFSTILSRLVVYPADCPFFQNPGANIPATMQKEIEIIQNK